MTPLQLTAKDYRFLEYLEQAAKQDELFQQLLKRKLEHASIVSPSALDPGISTIGSHVTFSVGGGSSEERVLTLHDNLPVKGVPLPVTTLRGLALLGLRAGDLFALRTHRGIIEPLKLEAVSHPDMQRFRQADGKSTVVRFAPLAATASTARPQPHVSDDDDPGPTAA